MASEDWVETVFIMRIIGSSISVAGCLFVLLTTFSFGSHRHKTHVRLVLCMVSCTMLEAITELMGDVRWSGPLCKIQAIISQIGDWSGIMYLTCIAFNIFQVIVRQNYNIERFEKYYHIIAWLMSGLFAIVPVIGENHYGPAGAWCWIMKDQDGMILRFISWYGPLTLIFVLVAVLYILVLKYLHKSWVELRQANAAQSVQAQIKLARRMIAYPLLFLIIWTFPLINRIHDWISNDQSLAWLTIVAVTTHSFQGALYSTVYGMDEDTNKRIRYKLVSIFDYCKGDRTSSIRPFLNQGPQSLNDNDSEASGVAANSV